MKIKQLLAEHLGVEEEDINSDDNLIDNLKMNAASISDFLLILEENNYDINSIDLTDILTVGDLEEIEKEEL